MVQNTIRWLHKRLGIDGSMKSHRRTTPAERNAIQINLMAGRFMDIGKTFFYGSIVAILVAAHLNKSQDIILGFVTLAVGCVFFTIGLLSSGWYIEEKSEPARVPMLRGKKRRKTKSR